LPPTLPEEIDKGQDWRAKIDEALAQAECFLLLYTGPNLDWSWCFYEAGAFAKMGRPRRKIFCLHPATQGPPSPLANLQTIRVESKPLGDWIKDDLRSITGRPQPTAKELSKIIKNIKELEEDKKKAGEYPESERLLGELDKYNRAYLELSLPRLQELLRREHK
jgi:hypothetical protein